ncbi:MAG: hypothetical protein QXS16_01255 [Pyrobaculum sp.]
MEKCKTSNRKVYKLPLSNYQCQPDEPLQAPMSPQLENALESLPKDAKRR